MRRCARKGRRGVWRVAQHLSHSTPTAWLANAPLPSREALHANRLRRRGTLAALYESTTAVRAAAKARAPLLSLFDSPLTPLSLARFAKTASDATSAWIRVGDALPTDGSRCASCMVAHARRRSPSWPAAARWLQSYQRPSEAASRRSRHPARHAALKPAPHCRSAAAARAAGTAPGAAAPACRPAAAQKHNEQGGRRDVATRANRPKRETLRALRCWNTVHVHGMLQLTAPRGMLRRPAGRCPSCSKAAPKRPSAPPPPAPALMRGRPTTPPRSTPRARLP